MFFFPRGTLLAVLIASAAMAGEEWRELAGPAWTMRYPPGYEKDARELDGLMRKTLDALTVEFAAEEPARLLKNLTCHIYVHGAPTSQAGVGVITLQTTFDGMTCRAELHLLAPSEHPQSARTSLDEPMDAAYFHKNLAHEYGTILLEFIARNKPSGWRFTSAPSWFIQGYEEYLGFFCASEHSRTVTYPKCRKLVASDPSRVGLLVTTRGDAKSHSIECRDPYNDGAVLLTFMHETWGRERVQAILKSQQDTFEAAAEEALGVDASKLYARWVRWIAAKPPESQP